MARTLTLDEDVEAKLELEAQKTGTDPQQLANEVLRRELKEPFEIRGPFATSIPGAGSFDCIARVLDELEGPEWK